MQLIYLVLTYVLIVLNFAGITVATERLTLSPACRRVFVIVIISLTLFNLEHIQGLGKLNWLWPLTTIASVRVIYRHHNRHGKSRFWRGELIFWGGLCYALIWRFCFPNIDSGSEHLTDLYFISNYYSGETLPPNDRWLSGSRFDFYYAFQHYCAALLGRIFNLDIGLTMNVSWTILIGLIASLVWDASSQVIKHRWLKGLILGCVLTGGNGLSSFMPWLIQHDESAQTAVHDIAIERIWASTRFSGLYDQYVNTDFGRKLVESSSQPDPGKRLELPFETIAYLTYLGDYHPPLGGLLIALWTLALIMRLEYKPIVFSPSKQHLSLLKRTPEWPAYFALGLTPALTLVTNTWVFPLQCVLLGSWMMYRQLFRRIAWFWMIAGLLAGAFSIYPFLTHFATHSLDTPISKLSVENHTPLLLFLTMHWPTLIWLIGGLLLWRTNRWCAWLSFTLALLLTMTELIVVDDPLIGKYQRFNTTLKWWSWLWPVTVTGILTLLIAKSTRFIKLFLIITIFPLFIYSMDLIRYLIYAPKPQSANYLETAGFWKTKRIMRSWSIWPMQIRESSWNQYPKVRIHNQALSPCLPINQL